LNEIKLTEEEQRMFNEYVNMVEVDDIEGKVKDNEKV
jgi:hypothetical protein